MSAPWGVLILAWVIPSLRAGTLMFVDIVDRREAPLLYWSIQLTWIACAFYFIWLDLGWWLSAEVGAP